MLANCSISHLLFQISTLQTTSRIHNTASVALQSFAMNHMSMLSQVIENVKLRELFAKGQEYRKRNQINCKMTKTMILDSIALYAEQWSKLEQVDLKYLSEWTDQIKELVVELISSLKEKIRSPKLKLIIDPDVENTLRRLHYEFGLVPADKAANNVIVVCKSTISIL